MRRSHADASFDFYHCANAAEKKSPEAANAATDIPRGQPSSRLLPNTAEAATGAPSFPGQFAGLVFTPGMALGHGMGPKMAPAPAPMVAPAPAPQQMLSKLHVF
jgi:hypothetical protein